ncbi:MAG: DivIVA domain-containing protein [Clostridiales bacterium]|nr:DivIVA domain-containing protein [Clostridiales bacterium]
MMTPQEVAEYGFARGKLGGYNTADVDSFMEAVTTDYTALYKENAGLKNKLKVLATKLAEYRETEESMRSIVSTARRMADGIVAEAEAHRQQMLQEADDEVAEYCNQLQQEIADAEAQLAAAQESTRSFVTTVRSLVSRELTFLDQISAVKGEEPAPQVPEMKEEIAVTAAAIDDSIRQMLSEEELAALDAAGAEAEADPTAAYNQEIDQLLDDVNASGDEDEATRRVDFSDVDFSRDYET